jgi:nicotinate phosphoribosyltransferase
VATPATRTRLPPETFRLPVERIRAGYYSDAYFNFTKELLEARGHCPRVTMQVFQKEHSILGGIDEAIAVLKLCSDDWEQLEVHALH